MMFNPAEPCTEWFSHNWTFCWIAAIHLYTVALNPAELCTNLAELSIVNLAELSTVNLTEIST